MTDPSLSGTNDKPRYEVWQTSLWGGWTHHPRHSYRSRWHARLAAAFLAASYRFGGVDRRCEVRSTKP